MTTATQANEPLCAELAGHLITSGAVHPAIKHPLLFAVPYFEPFNARYNAALAVKKANLQEALDLGDLESYVWTHERPYRAFALMSLHNRKILPPTVTSAELVLSVYTDTENFHEARNAWRSLFKHCGRDNLRAAMSLDDDRQRMAAWADDDVVQVFRGISGDVGDERDAPKGFSWTTDRDIARWFAQRYAFAYPRVWRAKTYARDVLFVYSGRGESEVVVLPEKLFNVSVRRVNT